MEVNNSLSLITINGNIKKITDLHEIKNFVDNVVNEYDSITIHLVDSISMPSAVIGYFNKLVLHQNIDLHLKVGNSALYNLLEDLNLTSVFRVSLV